MCYKNINETTGNDCSTYGGDSEYYGIKISNDSDNKRIKYDDDDDDSSY